MVSNNNNTDCANTCRWIAALIGLLGFVIFFWMADYRFISSLLLAALAGIGSWFILKLMLCNDETSSAEAPSSDPLATAAAASSANGAAVNKTSAPSEAASSASENAVAAAATSAAVVSTASSAAFTVRPSAPLAGEKELAERKGDWKYEAPVVEKAPAKAKAPAKTKAPAKAASGTKAPAKAAVKAKAPENRQMEDAIRKALDAGKLACSDAWDIAGRFKVPKMAVSGACESLNIKIKPCQLGAF